MIAGILDWTNQADSPGPPAKCSKRPDLPPEIRRRDAKVDFGAYNLTYSTDVWNSFGHACLTAVVRFCIFSFL